MTSKQNASKQIIPQFIPENALPPAENVTESLKNLSQALLLAIPDAQTQWGMFIGEHILEVLRLLSPFGAVTGLAMSGEEKAFTGAPKMQPLACELASFYADPESPAQSFLLALGQTLRSKEILLAFPDLITPPQSQENLIWVIHHDLIQQPLYPLIVRDLQRGLIKKWTEDDWNPEKHDSISSLLTGLRRMAPLINPDKFQEVLDTGVDGRMMFYLRDIAKTLKNLRRRSRPPLKEATQILYFRNFCTVLDREEWLDQPRQEGGPGGGGFRYTRYILMNLDDDMPEIPEALDGFREIHFKRLVEKIADDLNPGRHLTEEANPDSHRSRDTRLTYAEERAVMENFLDPSAWHVTHPSELAWFVKALLDLEASDKASLELTTFILSLILTGRSADWLQSIQVEENFTDALVKAPVFQPSTGLIRYMPDLVESYPTDPADGSDMFIPVEKLWALPVPECLRCRFGELAQKGEKRLFSTLVMENFKKLRKHLTQIFHQQHPHAPAFTEGRLRKGAFITLVQDGGLDLLLAAMLSGQWLNCTRVPIFYTTVSWPLLTDRYHLAMTNMWAELQLAASDLPDLAIKTDLVYEERNQGSPYHPLLSVQQEIIHRLGENILAAEAPHELHNMITLAALYALSFFGGLRISEVSLMARSQFDFDCTRRGVPVPTLAIKDAKTNRFTVAGRSLPMTSHIIPLLKKAMALDIGDGYAFHFYLQGEPRPVTESRLTDMREKAGVKLVRWHGNRQALSSHALVEGVSFDCINAILGHATAGMEPHNVYLPNTLPVLWQEYLKFCDTYARRLGWKEVLDVL
jgi:hypothetical protein